MLHWRVVKYCYTEELLSIVILGVVKYCYTEELLSNIILGVKIVILKSY